MERFPIANIPVGPGGWLVAGLMGVVMLLSSSEAALLSVSWLRVRHLIEIGDRRAIVVERILEKKDRMISSILFTENLCIIMATAVGTALAAELLAGQGAVVASLAATVVMTLVVLIFGEITPKTLAATFAEPWALCMARPIEILMTICIPVVAFFALFPRLILRLAGTPRRQVDAPSPEELSTIINLSERHGELAAEEGALLRNILELAETRAGDVMVPRTRMVAIETCASPEQILRKFQESRYSRFPVFEGSLDQIVGFLDIRDFLEDLAIPSGGSGASLTGGGGRGSVWDHLKPPVFVPESQRVGKLLTRMKEEGFQMAIVLDEYGGTAGLVTLTDLVEEIVGELEARLHAADPATLGEKSLMVASETKIEELSEWLKRDLPEGEYATVGGLVFGLLGREPQVGESVEAHALRFTVVEKKGYKIAKVMVTKP